MSRRDRNETRTTHPRRRALRNPHGAKRWPPRGETGGRGQALFTIGELGDFASGCWASLRCSHSPVHRGGLVVLLPVPGLPARRCALLERQPLRRTPVDEASPSSPRCGLRSSTSPMLASTGACLLETGKAPPRKLPWNGPFAHERRIALARRALEEKLAALSGWPDCNDQPEDGVAPCTRSFRRTAAGDGCVPSAGTA